MVRESGALGERTRRILATLVREHIDTGGPVASRALVRRGGFRLSSATIRHVLAQLDEWGYVRQPHASAGRVPTDLGYRSYVDDLLTRPRLARSAAAADARLQDALTRLSESDTEGVMASVPHVLSQASHAVAFALVPDCGSAAFHRIEFVPLGAGRVLVVVVTRTSQVTHKVIDLDPDLSPAELEQASNALNAEFSGMPLADVRRTILERLSEERLRYDRIMARALRLVQSSLERVGETQTLFVEGASSLVSEVAAPYSGITLSALSTLVTMIEEKHRLVRLLTEYIDGPGLTVVIGSEHQDPTLRQFSLVASTYADGDQTGTIGLIGPLRMQYVRAIPLVDHVAHAVSRILACGARPPRATDS
ncbi:MAG TPA: heat-inducible transcriptional repressor HrcA [Vicinamibacterales bacterium]|nr:heat-inducible transcriptional repressor HrcA [Vicinamibacterales bacterium]HPW21103.1 heat-inducible transcriptional repressor HrcA [Vicinamibacterales bacterium]